MVVLYLDLRCRHEDYDLQLLASDVAGDRSGKPPAQQPAGPATDRAVIYADALP